MNSFFSFHSKQESFRLFSSEHLLTMGIILTLCILLVFFRKNFREERKNRLIRFSLAFLLVFSESVYHVWLLSGNEWSVKTALPLHLSDLAVFLAIIMLLRNNCKLLAFMYFAGLGSAIQAILTPNLGHFSFPHFRYVEFFVSHGTVVLSILFMVFSCKFRPTIRSIWTTVLIVDLYAACIFILNKWLGANYLYIMHKPGNSSSLLNYLGPWPWYLFWMELVMIISFYILYSPFWLKRRWIG